MGHTLALVCNAHDALKNYRYTKENSKGYKGTIVTNAAVTTVLQIDATIIYTRI